MAGGGDELKLLNTWFSPFGSRVMLALHLKGLSYEYMEEEDVINNKSQLLLESNPVHKKVPVLFHKGKVLCESMIIVNYLEEAFPDRRSSPLTPTNVPSLASGPPLSRPRLPALSTSYRPADDACR
jgi:glutathione S-transferase